MSEEIECESCYWGVTLGVAKEVCMLTQEEEGRNKCSELYEKVDIEEISIPEYLRRIKEQIKDDSQAVFTITEIEKMLNKDGSKKPKEE